MEEQIKKLQRTQRVQWVVILLLLFLVAGFWINSDNDSEIIHAKGLVIENENGQAMISLGYPVPQTTGRIRSDTLNGMLFLDDKGADRIHLGPHGKLYLGGNYYGRSNDEGWSLFFNDPKGEERSGYGYSDSDNSVGFGMDYGGEHGGEAIYMYAAPNIAFITLNADLQENQAIRDRIVLWHETDKDLSIVKVSDSSKDGRLIFRAEKGADPGILLTDSLMIQRKLPISTLKRNP